MTDTSINLTDVNTHLASSQGITDTLEPAIDDIVREERAVIGASGGYAPDEAAVNLPEITDAWRANDAKLRTIHDVLIANGVTGAVTGLDTHSLRNDVADANGVDSRTGFEIRDDGLDIIVDGGTGADIITVTQNPDGSSVITVKEEGSSITERFTLTPEETERLLIDGGIGNDTITINPYIRPRVGPPTGLIVFEPSSTPPIGFRINGGSGNDVITGGLGDDTIDAGRGRDYVDAGRGDDTVHGGQGYDTIYGGLGNDNLHGDGDNDYLDGGRGDDSLWGGEGNDIVAGGNGDDHLYGGDDDDVIIAGRGQDTIRDTLDTTDNDVVYAQDEDTVAFGAGNNGTLETVEVYEPTSGSQISIDPGASVEDRDRIQSDLDTLAAIPAGAGLLRSIDENPNGHSVTIGIDNTDGSSAGPASNDGTYEVGGVNGFNEDGTAHTQVGQDGSVSYNAQSTQLYEGRSSVAHEDWMDTPPIVILQHELLHTEDYVYGSRDPGESVHVEHDNSGNAVTAPGATDPDIMTRTDTGGGPDEDLYPVRNREASVVGLPFDEDSGLNGTPPSAAADVDANSRPNTENELREQLGLDARRYY